MDRCVAGWVDECIVDGKVGENMDGGRDGGREERKERDTV